MDKPDIDRIIAKALSGEASPHEQEALDAWLKADVQNRQYFGQLQEFWQQRTIVPASQAVVEATWANIQQKKEQKSRAVQPDHVTFKPRVIWFHLAKYAASLALLLGIGYGLWYYSTWQDQPFGIGELSMNETWLEKKAHPGQKLIMQLPDGSTVKLNAGSTLSMPKTFTANKREVRLSGEAFFDIAHQPDRPFYVYTESVTTLVKGTSFTVKAYPTDTHTSVALIHGKVELSAVKNGERLELAPAEMAVFSPGVAQLQKQPLNQDLIAWVDGRLVFRDASFQEVVKTLENWYGVTIVAKRPIDLGSGFRAEYQNQSLEEVLTGISYTGKFNFKVTDKQVIID
jgi:ferric-dicitrate binding protein FerR (iron transport regulator)